MKAVWTKVWRRVPNFIQLEFHLSLLIFVTQSFLSWEREPGRPYSFRFDQYWYNLLDTDKGHYELHAGLTLRTNENGD